MGRLNDKIGILNGKRGLKWKDYMVEKMIGQGDNKIRG